MDPEDLEKRYEIGKAKLENYKQYGAVDWYDFHISRWGTKWGAHEVSKNREDEETLVFDYDTAWSFPSGIFNCLRKKFPDVKITVWFADEDMCGGNCNFLQLENGRIFYLYEAVEERIKRSDPDITKEALLKKIGDFHAMFGAYLWCGEDALYDEDVPVEMSKEEFFGLMPKRVRDYTGRW